MKHDLLQSKVREQAVREELKKVREREKARKENSANNDNLTTQLVLKHGAKVKAAMSTPKGSQANRKNQGRNKRVQKKGKDDTSSSGSDFSGDDTEEDKSRNKRVRKKQQQPKKPQTSSSDSDTSVDGKEADKDSSKESNRGEADDKKTETEQGESDDKKPETKQGIAADVGEDERSEISTEDKVPGGGPKKNADVQEQKKEDTEDKASEEKDPKVNAVVQEEKEKEDKCKGHADLLQFLFEEDPRYFAPDQKFENAKCMKCATSLTNKDTKPTQKKPVHFCPHYEEDVCEAALCHGCFVELNTSTLTTRRRRNQT
jgi:hypothetical protein